MTIGALAAVLLLVIGLPGCPGSGTKLPSTLAGAYTSFSYVPLDPLPVVIAAGDLAYSGKQSDMKLTGTFKPLLDSLPDEAVRMAIGEYDASGTLVYGPGKIGVSGQSYQVVIDYISVDTANVSVYIDRVRVDTNKEVSVFRCTGYRANEIPGFSS